MKDKVWTLTLCPRCKSDFERSGLAVVKHGWQDGAEQCEFCQQGRGFDYDIFSKDGKGTP